MYEDDQLHLEACQANNNPLMDGNSRAYPILALDFAEHAYYDQYQDNWIEYHDGLLNLLDWKKAQERVLKVREEFEMVNNRWQAYA